MSFVVESLRFTPTENDDETDLSKSECLEPVQEQDQEQEISVAEGTQQEQEIPPSCLQRTWKSFISFLHKYEFPLLIILAILLARAYPPLGAIYLAPDITATWIAVIVIFIVAGLGLRTEELSKAFTRIYFNAFVQIFSFFVVSVVVYGVSRLLIVLGILNTALADGMVICASLPMAINSVIVLTGSTGGDEAAAVFNSSFANIVGIFLSPVLILLYLGSGGSIPLGQVFYRLTLRVIVPLILGQLIQRFWVQARDFVRVHKRQFKKVQELSLVFIVYTIFSTTFLKGAKAGLGDVFLMILYQLLLMIGLFIVAWYSLRLLFRDEPELRVMGLFGCVQKTVALGVPLIGSLYEDNPNIALYTLPILIWHPMQLVVGSLPVPWLTEFVRSERKRLDDAAAMQQELAPTNVEVPGGNAAEPTEACRQSSERCLDTVNSKESSMDEETRTVNDRSV